MLDIHGLALAAAQRIQPHIRRTPLEPSADLAHENKGQVFLKLEIEIAARGLNRDRRQYRDQQCCE